MAVVIFKPDFIGYCYVKKVVGHPLTITMGSWHWVVTNHVTMIGVSIIISS